MSFNERLHNWRCPSWLGAIVSGLLLGSLLRRATEGDTALAVLYAALFAMWVWITVQACMQEIKAREAKRVDLSKHDH